MGAVDVAERERIQAAYIEAWNTHDAQRIASFFTDDATYDDRGASEIARGPKEIAAHAARIHAAFPDLSFELVRTAHGEELSMGEWRSRMTHRGGYEGMAATGRVVESAGVDVATLDPDGLISHLVSYYDSAAMGRQLGVLPARGSRSERALVLLATLPARLRGT